MPDLECIPTLQPTLSDPAAPYLLPSTAVIPYIQIFNVREEALVFPQPGCNYIDVRDAGEVHARALEVPEAGGERLIGVSRMSSSPPHVRADDTHGLLSPSPRQNGATGSTGVSVSALSIVAIS